MLPEESLEQLLDHIRRSDRSSRIELRDSVVIFGQQAIDPMAEWLDDREFAGFAVRVLERIGRSTSEHKLVVDALVEAYPSAPSSAIARDIETALGQMNSRVTRPEALTRRRAAAPIPPGRPGRPGRRYWAMRTSVSNPEFIWSEVRHGRLRQGWGWTEEQDLRRISEHVRIGAELSSDEKAAWPARRMLGSEHDGIRYDDLVVTQNLPKQGHVSVCRVIGPYEFAVPQTIEDYGHILPVEVMVEDVSRYDARVSDALRHAISLRPRLYEITPYGGDIEVLVSRPPGTKALSSN